VNKDSDRNYNLDLLRILACLAVIAIHSTDHLLYGQPVGNNSWIFANVVQSFSRWAVPVFVMISGALMINSEQSKSAIDFYTKRIKKIIIPLLFWSFTYWLLGLWTLDGQIDFAMFLKSLAEGNPYPWHFYFLFVILGLYLVTPLINQLFVRLSRRDILIATLVSVASAITWETVNVFTTASINNAVTLFMPYLSYYLLGYYISTSKTIDTGKRLFWGFAGLSVVIAVVSTIISASFGLLDGLQLFNYFNPILILSSVCIFVAMLKSSFILSKKIKSLIQEVASLTFGVYLIHLLLIKIILEIFGHNYSILLSVGIFVLSTICSFVVIRIMRTNPVLRMVAP